MQHVDLGRDHLDRPTFLSSIVLCNSSLLCRSTPSLSSFVFSVCLIIAIITSIIIIFFLEFIKSFTESGWSHIGIGSAASMMMWGAY